MRTLLVAPRHESLPVGMADSEVGDILNSGLGAIPVLGAVTAERFLATIASNMHDILFLVTHGLDEGVVLTDGVLPASLFIQAVRDRFDLVVLNSCSGLSVAQMIQNETGAAVICTIGEVDDRAAYFTGSQLAKSLASGLSYYDAYKRARPGSNTTYVFLAGKSMSQRDIRPLVEEIVAEKMVDVLAHIAELKEEIHQERAERRGAPEGVVITSEQLNRILWALITVALVIAIGVFVLANAGGVP